MVKTVLSTRRAIHIDYEIQTHAYKLNISL